jgi:hypothetical protein
MHATAAKDEVTLAVSSGAFTDSDMAAAIETIGASFQIRQVDLQRGGPDYIGIVLTFSGTLLQSLGPSIAASAIWDGLKLLLSRWRPIPSHYAPDRTIDPSIEFEVEDQFGRITAVVRTSDSDILKAAMSELPSGIERLRARTRSSTPHGGPWLTYDSDADTWIEPPLPTDSGMDQLG